MHSFWTLFQAEFAAESLIRVLFGGKFPRFVALMLLFMIGSWYVCWSLIRISYRLLKWIIVTENMTVRSKLKKVAQVGKPYGDRVEKIRFENGIWILNVIPISHRTEITSMEFQVAKSTGQLRIFAHIDGRPKVELLYGWIRQFLPNDQPILMHVDYSAYIYYHLRNNFL